MVSSIAVGRSITVSVCATGITVSGVTVSVTGITVTVVTVVSISLSLRGGLRGGLSLSGPLAVVMTVTKTGITVTTGITVVTGISIRSQVTGRVRQRRCVVTGVSEGRVVRSITVMAIVSISISLGNSGSLCFGLGLSLSLGDVDGATGVSVVLTGVSVATVSEVRVGHGSGGVMGGISIRVSGITGMGETSIS